MQAGSAHVDDDMKTVRGEKEFSLLQIRRTNYGPNSPLFFDSNPLEIVKGSGCYIYDEVGTEYLDCINNVSHVGHCNRKVAKAVSDQLFTLNTNSRYLHQKQGLYTKKLLSVFPPQLQTLYLVASGSEANDLALRITSTCNPGAGHVAVLAGGYHGHLSSLIPLSSYKFWGKGGSGKPPYVHVMPCPDPFRGQHLDGRAAARAAIAAAHRAGGRIGAFIAETVPSCGGQIVLPPGYLQDVYEEMRAEGAVCIADEVQCGFGRAGDAFWAFEMQGVVPDMVSIGKPMGNGYPIAGLVVRAELARGFANGMDYFSTYGGSTAAVAAGLATLEVILEEGLQGNAKQVGDHLLVALRVLAPRYPFIADVRGVGLMVGLEIITDQATKLPAPMLASWIRGRMRERRVLVSTDGPYDNVIKLKPALVFGRKEADKFLEALRAVLDEELTPQQWSLVEEQEARHRQDTLNALMYRYTSNAVQLMAGLQEADRVAAGLSSAQTGSCVQQQGAVDTAAAAGVKVESCSGEVAGGLSGQCMSKL